LLFEGSITLCIPLQEALQVPDAETTFPVVYNQTISSIVLFYTVFGFLCWRAFGDDVSTVLTTSLPEGALATTVQLAYSIAVILTFPLQIFPALEIIVHQVELRLQGESEIVVQLSPWQRRMVCAVVIVLLSIIAVVEMDNLGKVVALMGSLLGCPLAFVFPPLIHSKIIPNAPTKLDWAVSGAGILAMIGATLITLATWSEPGERRRLDVSSIFGLG
jgi:proton-coupled amino acid transporter